MIDLLAIMAHPDDAELLCGGTLARAAAQGHRVGVLDLTAGESGSAGSAPERAREAEAAAGILGLALRRTAGLPDAALQNTPEARNVVAAIIRELRPTTVILHWPEARHPDHAAASALGHDACFIAGLKRAPIDGEPHRPKKVLYALTYQEAHVKPTFVVDISAFMERKLEAVFAFHSQLANRTALGDVLGGDRPIREQILAHHAHYGSYIRVPYGEPFYTRETMAVEDVVNLAVRTF